MDRYIGMDTHTESCTLGVLNAKGKALVGYFQQQPGQVHLCVEEGELAPWLWEILTPHVAELVVCRPQGKKGPKSDTIDAFKLAERLRTGQIKSPVFKSPRQFAKLRELARVYEMVTVDLARAKNRLKSSFRRRGIRCAGTNVYGEEGRAQLMRQLPAALRGSAELLGYQHDHLERLKDLAEAEMVEESHRHRVCHLLETVPGLGAVRVAQLVPIVVTPHRFRTKRQFWSYCGFGVVTRSTSDWVRVKGKWQRSQVEQTRGLNFNFNRTLKRIFKGAATTVISHQSANSFRAAYDRLCAEGTKPNLAKVTVARKIAATTLAMWKSEEVYDPAQERQHI